MERLAEVHREYKGTGVQFLGVVTDVYGWDGKVGNAAVDYISGTKAEYPNVINVTELTTNMAYIPSTHIYNSSGTLIAKVTGEHSTREWINIIETVMAKQ